MGKVIAALAIAVLMAGCTHTGTDGCSLFAPIRPTADDVAVISDQLVTGLVTHNETGARVCGWNR